MNPLRLTCPWGKAKPNLSKTEYDRLGILATTEKRDRQKSTDDLVLNRRRSIILTHPKVLEREIEYRKKRDEAAAARVTRKRIKETSVVITSKKAARKITLTLF